MSPNCPILLPPAEPTREAAILDAGLAREHVADADLELIADFVAESRESIAEAEAMLLALEADPEDMDAVNTVFRVFHTVKGTSGFLGLPLVADFAHHAESLLDRMRAREIMCVGGYADLALRSVDMIKLLIDAAVETLGGEAVVPGGYHALVSALADPDAAGISAAISDETTAIPRLGDILVGFGRSERAAIEAALRSPGGQPAGLAIVQSGAASLTDVAHALRRQKFLSGQLAADASIRVRVDRLDRLVDLVGELALAQATLADDPLLGDDTPAALRDKVADVGRIARELQALTMATRMVSLTPTFQKLARVVRDVAQKTGKQVEFATEGEHVEIDRGMVEVISDALIHMVRNAVDHGLEGPHERRAAGKPIAGRLRLRARHVGSEIVLELADDGRGLDRDRLVRKALERGLVASSDGMADHEILALIFIPGFSTAQTLTDISGRGVGMDVVRRRVESLAGRVVVASEPARGSTFALHLPATRIVTDGWAVGADAPR